MRFVRDVGRRGSGELCQVELKALGFELADVDEDGTTDIVTTVKDRLSALSSRAVGMFETRDLAGVSGEQFHRISSSGREG